MSGLRRSHRASSGEGSVRRLLALVPLLAVIALVTLCLVRIGTSGQPLSTVDEPAHLDTAFRLHHDGYPHRGSLYGDDLVQTWACGVGHESPGMAVPCGPGTGPATLPSGQYTTGYIHYPTYFLGGEAFRWAIDPDGGSHGPIDAYRAWSGILGGAGLLACLLAGWLVGLRGSALWAATLVPISGSGILFLNTVVNPGSAAVLCGALIAAAGLRWMRTGRGFWWLFAAVAVAALVAVTAALPAGAFLLAILVTRAAPWIGLRLPATTWSPRWWQLGSLAALVLAPIVIWNRVIEAEATVPNSTIYGAVPPADAVSVVRGAVEELFTLLTPWIEGQVLLAGPDEPAVIQILRAAAIGIPLVISVLVFGLLAAVLLGLVPSPAVGAEEAGDGPAASPTWPLRLLAGCAVATLLLYPVALRIGNSFNFGFDYGIVNRYSIGLAPLLTLLVLLLFPGRVVSRVLAGLAALCVLGVCLTAF